MISWDELQKEVASWARHNFGEQPASHPMLGLVEEIGEFMAAREGRDHAAMEDALGDQSIYILNLCQKVGLDFEFHISGPEANNGATNYADREILGALGVACHAVLKYEQGIRGVDLAVRASHMVTALGIWYRWASWQCLEHNIDPMKMITIKVWAQVKRRDWTKNRTNAHEVVRDDLAAGK